MDIDITKLDTSEELHFAWYLEELKEHGYIVGYDSHPYTFELFKGMNFTAIANKNQLPKTKSANVKERELLPKNTYTPDFAIYWTKKAEGIFYELIGFNTNVVIDYDTPFLIYKDYPGLARNCGIDYLFQYPEGSVVVSLVDVKPAVANRFAGNLSSIYTFPIEQKWVMEKYGIYIQKVIAEGRKTCLFAKTFTPRRYLQTDVSMARRNIHHDTPNIEEYTEYKLKEYGRIKGRYNPQSVLFNSGNK